MYENDMGDGRILRLERDGCQYMIVEVDGDSSQVVGSYSGYMEALTEYHEYFKEHCDFS